MGQTITVKLPAELVEKVRELDCPSQGDPDREKRPRCWHLMLTYEQAALGAREALGTAASGAICLSELAEKLWRGSGSGAWQVVCLSAALADAVREGLTSSAKCWFQLHSEVAERVGELSRQSGHDSDAVVRALLSWFVTAHEEAERKGWEAFDRIAEGLFDGPGDLAEKHDERLYGPKPWPR